MSADEKKDGASQGGRVRGLAKRLFRESDGEGEGRDAKEILGSLLDTGDKAKTEIVRLLAREARGYLEAMDLHNDIHHILSSYSLEVQASFQLKPKAEPAPKENEPATESEVKEEPPEGLSGDAEDASEESEESAEG
jgi:hypothetical protein